MADRDLHTRLDANLREINAALDRGERRRFMLLAKRRHDLKAKLSRVHQVAV